MKKLVFSCGLAMAMASFSAPTQAAIIVQTGLVGGSGDVDNVLFTGCTAITDTTLDNMLQGCLNTDRGYTINFTADENIVAPAIGQARIESADGSGFSQLLIDPVTGTFSKLQLNIDASADGFVTFTGVPGGTSTSFALTGSGQNFFTITGENFSTVFLTTTVDIIADIQQIRLGTGTSVPPGDTVPEPATMALFGLGLLGAGFARRRRQ